MPYTSDDLMRCEPQAGCKGCAWHDTAEIVCRGVCIGERDICPWLMVCRCVNPDMGQKRGKQLERLALEQPPDVHLAPVSITRHRIRLGEYDIRQGRDHEIIRQIAASIAEHGLFSAPGGVAAEDGYIDLLMGHNRVLAVLSLLEWQDIPIRIFHWWGNDQAAGRWARKIAAFQENAVRQQMTFDEEVRLVYSYWLETGQTVREIADRFKMSRSWVQERISWGRSLSAPAKGEQNKVATADQAASIELPLAHTYTLTFEERAQPDPSESPESQVAAPKRITFPRSEVEDWLGALVSRGIIVPDDQSLREQFRIAMNIYTSSYGGEKTKI